jgi:hypothetical protein
MKPVEIVLRREEGIRENDGGDKTKLYYNHICKYYNVSSYTTITC